MALNSSKFLPRFTDVTSLALCMDLPFTVNGLPPLAVPLPFTAAPIQKRSSYCIFRMTESLPVPSFTEFRLSTRMLVVLVDVLGENCTCPRATNYFNSS